MGRRRVNLRIEGRVQGVFFRESARQQAERLGLSGWVKNMPDGSVAALAEGEQDAVDAFVAWCRRGPPAARVVEVAVTDEPPRGDISSFAVVR
jgi:acylphosphatase